MSYLTPHRILVIRTDRIGDTVLTLPLCGLLAAKFPAAEIVYMGRAYTKPIVDQCRHVHGFIDWEAIRDAGDPAAILREAKIDLALHVWPKEDIARAVYAAGIPRRVGTMRRWHNWKYCNELVWVRRQGSSLHEGQLNTLVGRRVLGLDAPPTIPELSGLFGLVAPAPSDAVRAVLRPDRFNLVIHPLSGGSAPRWPLERIRELVSLLSADRFQVIITGTPAEHRELAPWMTTLPSHVIAASHLEAPDLMALLAHTDGAMACSTGPIHLAAALGTRTCGLYPNATLSWDVKRWQPIGPRAEWITPDEPCPNCNRLRSNCPCLSLLLAAPVAEVAHRWARDAGR